MTGPPPNPAWRRNLYVMTATVFVVYTAFAFVLPFLPLFVRELGVPDRERAALWAGVLIGIAPLLAGLLAPLWGRLADRYGQKQMALRALLSYVVLLALSAAVGNVWELFLCRVGIGLFGGIGPLGLAMATALAPREQTGRAVGLVQAAQILSAAFGPFAGGFLADTIGVRRTFLVTAMLCAVAVGLVALYYRNPPLPAPSGVDPVAGPAFFSLLKLPGVPALIFVLFLVSFVGRSFTPILPLHLERLGVPAARLASSTGALIAVYSLAAALSATLLGRATRRLSPRQLLLASLAGGALAVAPMVMVPSFRGFLVLAVLLGLASGGALTLCYTMGGLMVPGEAKATAFGFFSGAALFGGAVSPSVAGLLAHWNLLGIYWIDSALFAALALGLLGGLGRVGAPPISPAPRA
ncbi:MAG TPA: MFS transporter [Vicinamibacteria bacterium]|nr:MFS transporter [Vicinamibacteria bacterium]